MSKFPHSCLFKFKYLLNSIMRTRLYFHNLVSQVPPSKDLGAGDPNVSPTQIMGHVHNTSSHLITLLVPPCIFPYRELNMLQWSLETSLSSIEPYQAANNAYIHYQHGQQAMRILMLLNISLLMWTDKNKDIYVITYTETITYTYTNNNDPIPEQRRKKYNNWLSFLGWKST